MNMESEHIITITLSLIAIIVSIISYFQNSTNQKRELRLEKLEQIIEILHALNLNYQYFEDTYLMKIDFLNNNLSAEKKTLYNKQINELIKISKEIDLRKKLARLYVLNNSYLPKNNLQDKISVYISVYTSIGEHTLIKPFNKIEVPFNKFPKPWDILDFTEQILKELIKEMNLGYKNNINYNHSYEKEFKQKYNL